LLLWLWDVWFLDLAIAKGKESVLYPRGVD